MHQEDFNHFNDTGSKAYLESTNMKHGYLYKHVGNCRLAHSTCSFYSDMYVKASEGMIQIRLGD